MDSESSSHASQRGVSTGGPASDDAPANADSGERQESLKEEIVKSAKGQDDPVGKKHPDVPFLVVGLTYLAVLGVVFLVVALVLFFWW